MTQAADTLQKLISTTARAHAALTAAADDLVADLGLSTAREAVICALLEAGSPSTVSQLARALELSRQAVQRVADDLHDRGLADYSNNPDHARAKLLWPTEAGRAAYGEALKRKALWLEELADRLPVTGLEVASELLGLLSRRAVAKTPKKA